MPIILAIDTSCDDTSVAILNNERVLVNIIASQVALHIPYGGVFPTIARQEHARNIDRCLALALKKAQLDFSRLDALAVTYGPGLAPALEVGVAKAKELALKHRLPLIPVNHIAGHALSPLLDKSLTIPLPLLAIVVSGGHTDFILIKDLNNWQLLGATLDDAAGEALDKIGRLLGLDYPAAATLEKLAASALPNPQLDAFLKFPLPLTARKDFNLSFSGLKTHAKNRLRMLERREQIDLLGLESKREDFLASFALAAQTGVFRHLTYKLTRLLTHLKTTTPNDFPSIVFLGGGCAANKTLRQTLRATLKPFNLSLRVPSSRRFCADNAAMIAFIAMLNPSHALGTPEEINALQRNPQLTI
ncbi:tRNA (adenosine(37)-N6)-threonylcarbamoyltransferase complex transferase subunit TsaD [Microgenomates group bacterium]|nr:tRNA (adenosine(37)-N6)-threonylcarbamoyltransferase complex transferase subunit TsaD [Microgenomates group bacterium]